MCFMATIAPELVSRALYTVPKVPLAYFDTYLYRGRRLAHSEGSFNSMNCYNVSVKCIRIIRIS